MLFPLFINLIVWVFIIPLAKQWARDPNFNGNIFVLALLSLAIFILVIFLFISVKLPLTVGTLQFRAGQLSAPLTISFFGLHLFPITTFLAGLSHAPGACYVIKLGMKCYSKPLLLPSLPTSPASILIKLNLTKL
jgi:D-alanyl-lipoteichoic acid acyltransferase DltB (MBOAT superfamily)